MLKLWYWNANKLNEKMKLTLKSPPLFDLQKINLYHFFDYFNPSWNIQISNKIYYIYNKY